MARVVLSRLFMPASREHEVLVDLLRNPELVRALLGESGVVQTGVARQADAILTTPELRADLVVLFGRARRLPKLAVVVEVQRSRERDKRFAWPHYETSARSKHRCDACVLVLTTNDALARWSKQPVRVGPLNTFRALVIGPGDLPAIAEDERTRAGLSVLTAIVHGRNRSPDAAELAVAACSVLDGMPDDRYRVYFDTIETALHPAARKEWKAMMDLRKFPYEGPTAKKFVAEGMAKGMAQGIAEGERKALLTFLRARGFRVTRKVTTRIRECDDAAILHGWIERAARVAKLDEVFDDEEA